MLYSLFGAEDDTDISGCQPLIVGAVVDDEVIDEDMEAVVSLGGLWFCVVPVKLIRDEGIWHHEILEASIRDVLGTMDMEFMFNHNDGYQAVPISHILSALTTSAGVNFEIKEPDEYWTIIKSGLPFRVPEGCSLE